MKCFLCEGSVTPTDYDPRGPGMLMCRSCSNLPHLQLVDKVAERLGPDRKLQMLAVKGNTLAFEYLERPNAAPLTQIGDFG